MIQIIKNKLPKSWLAAYHYFLSLVGAVIYRFPSREICVIAVTGTKGKTTVTELVSAMLEEAGNKTAIASTLRFKIGRESKRNRLKMTMPGRLAIQKFLRNAVDAGCTHAVIEITSQGVLQHRHKFIALDALIVTNIAPEHIESHGSYEAYVEAKVKIAKALAKSSKASRVLVVNRDDKEADKFLAVDIPTKLTYGRDEADKLAPKLRLPGLFNAYNAAAAATLAKYYGIPDEVTHKALYKFEHVPGRMEKVMGEKPQPFDVYVDYAHTPDSLKAVYQTLKSSITNHQSQIICVLGSTGGGRDTWKRPVMGSIADDYCDKIILTDEDPYDENPKKIVDDLATGMKKIKPEIIMDRQAAIRRAVTAANTTDIIIITGKGTDPFIMGPKGRKIPWDDAEIVRHELNNI